MSWILGAIRKKQTSFNDKYFSVCKDVRYKYKSDKIKVYAGGFERNLYFENNSVSPNINWIVTGIGLENNSDETKIFNQKDWSRLLSSKNSFKKLNSLDGHFIVVTWNENSVKIHSDVLGLRDIYILENEGGIFFSTNAVWLSKVSSLDINFSEFGSRWLLFNQISNKSIFGGINRIVAGSKAEIFLTDKPFVKFSEYNWIPSNLKREFGVNEYSSKLSSLIKLKIPDTKDLSLSLSGGMDSRVILSFLLKSKMQNFDAHTFGNPIHPDSIIVKKIVEDYGIKHEQINFSLPSIDESIKEIQKYTSETLVNNAASAILQLQNYSFLNGRNTILIDGGFGEVWRREFFYRLYIKGKDALLKQDVKKIIPHLRLHRADIFNDDISIQMEQGIENQLSEFIEKMPTIEANNIGNWLDLFAIKTRLPNYYLHEQARLDNCLTSIMPFIQQSIINDIFNMHVNLRKNGKLFRKIIKSNESNLSKYKLAKGNSTYPYFFNSLHSRLLSITQRKLKLKTYTDNNNHKLLRNLKEYIYDISNSKSVKENNLYNYSKLQKLIGNYYNGNLNVANGLDWWLSFELFRQSIINKKI